MSKKSFLVSRSIRFVLVGVSKFYSKLMAGLFVVNFDGQNFEDQIFIFSLAKPYPVCAIKLIALFLAPALWTTRLKNINKFKIK